MLRSFEGQPRVFEIAPNLLKKLPIETSSYETHPLTGESGWHAPKGFGFKITGRMEMGAYPYGAMGWGPPIYKREFTGKWIGAVQDDLDSQSSGSSYVGKIRLKDDPEVGYLQEFGGLPYIDDVEEGIEIDPASISPKDHYFWFYRYAEPQSSRFKVELVEVQEKPQRLSKVSQPWNRIEVPRRRTNGSMTSVEFGEVYESAFGPGTYTEELRLGYMRDRREQGFPFSDDPLRDLVIPTEMDIVDRLRALRISIEPKRRSQIIFQEEVTDDDMPF